MMAKAHVHCFLKKPEDTAFPDFWSEKKADPQKTTLKRSLVKKQGNTCYQVSRKFL
jgi:hypothetical protein